MEKETEKEEREMAKEKERFAVSTTPRKDVDMDKNAFMNMKGLILRSKRTDA